MSLGILTGIADRFAAFVLAGYCGVTALLWKQFWKRAISGPAARAASFLGFLEELALAGGFLLVTFGTGAATVETFVSHPFASSKPYSLSETAR